MSISSETIIMDLGSSRAGILASLRAQKFNPATNTDIGTEFDASYFQEQGFGNYTFTADFDSDDGIEQGVKIYDAGATFLETSLVTLGGGDTGSTLFPDLPSVTGAYNSLEDMQIIRGVENIRSWSQKGGAADLDTNAVSAAILKAKQKIDSRLNQAFLYPLVAVDGTVITSVTLDFLRWSISEPIASYNLYATRGLDIENDPVANLLKIEYDAAIAQLEYLVTNPSSIDLSPILSTQSPRAGVVDPLYGICW